MNWDRLSVTFRKFDAMPLNETAAECLGWLMFKNDCATNNDNGFVGKRYALSGDKATVLIYDMSGNIAGIQMGHVADDKYLSKPRKHGGAMVKDNGYMYVTAYFIDPNRICNKHLTRRPGNIGDRLLFLTGPQEYLTVPIEEENIKMTEWVVGQCFRGMGQHYWYGIKKDMKCEDGFPAFVMYTNGLLHGFGFSTDWDMDSSRVEHPTAYVLNFFFRPETLPDCLKEATRTRTTQHVFFTKDASVTKPICPVTVP